MRFQCNRGRRERKVGRYGFTYVLANAESSVTVECKHVIPQTDGERRLPVNTVWFSNYEVSEQLCSGFKTVRGFGTFSPSGVWEQFSLTEREGGNCFVFNETGWEGEGTRRNGKRSVVTVNGFQASWAPKCRRLMGIHGCGIAYCVLVLKSCFELAHKL